MFLLKKSHIILLILIFTSLVLFGCQGNTGKPYIAGSKKYQRRKTHPYRLQSAIDSEGVKGNSKSPYGFRSSLKEMELRKKTEHPYSLRNSKSKEKEKLYGNRYGLAESIREKKLKAKGSPYGLGLTNKDKNIKRFKHPYGLSTSAKEKRLAKEGKSPYGFQSTPKDYRLARVQRPYFDLDVTKPERDDPNYTAYEFRAKGEVIREDDFLEKFNEYKKPKIRALLVGNQNYASKKDQLKYAINDTIVFKGFLTQVMKTPEERIRILQDQTLSQFISGFEAFVKSVKKNELVLIFYSGHMKENGMPLFVDMNEITVEKFSSLLKLFKNDTALIMDGSYIAKPGASLNKRVVDKLDNLEDRANIIRIYSNLTSKDKKEGNYKNKPGYQKNLRITYSLLNQMGTNTDGNGIFTLIFVSFFADFFFNVSKEAEVSFETLHSYMHTKISNLEESKIQVRRPKKYPEYGSKFEIYENNFILFKKLRGGPQSRLSKKDRLLKAMFKKGVRLQSEGKYSSAVNLFLSVVKKNKGSDFKNTKARLAECYLEIGSGESDKDPDRAVTTFKKALRYNPKSSGAMYNLGKTYEKKGDRKKALSAYTKTLSFKDEMAEKSRKRLVALRNKIAAYKSINGKMKGGYAAYNQGEYNEALLTFKSAKKDFKKQGDKVGVAISLNNIGSVYIAQKKYDKALKTHKKSLRLKRKLRDKEGVAYSKNNIGVVYYYQGDYKRAVRNLKSASEIYDGLNKKEGRAVTLINLSKCYLKLNKKTKAIRYQQQAVDLLEAVKSPKLKKEKGILNKLEK